MNLLRKKTSTAILSLIILSLGLTFALAAVITTRNVSNSITIVSQGDFEVYADPSCTQPLSSLSWNQMGANQWQVQTVYLLNNGSGDPIYVSYNTPDIPMGLYVQLSNPTTYFSSPSPPPSSTPYASPSPSNGFWMQGSSLTLYQGQPVQADVYLMASGVSSGSYSWTLSLVGQDTP